MHRGEGLYANPGGLFQDSAPGTRVTDDWLNAVQEELCGVISAAGYTVLSAATDNWGQLWPAIAALAGTPAKGYAVYASPASGGTWWPSSYGRALGDKITVAVVGAGGGGGGVSALIVATGGAGGGFGLSLHTLSAFNINSGVTITIGSGGAGGASGLTSGVAGTTTSWGTYITCTGGTEGFPNPATGAGGLGGSAVGGNLFNNGGSPGGGLWSTAGGSHGGNSPLGGGGGRGGRGTIAENGGTATAPGAGGGGGGYFNSSRAGGAGANGLVLITW